MIINFLVLFSVLCCFCGLALDVGMLQLRKLQLQHAADAAALGAVYEKARGNAGWVAAGKADAALNGFTDGVNGVTISIISPPTSGTYSGKTNAIQATVRQTYHTSFMGMMVGAALANPGASSVAANSANPDCVYLMGPGITRYSLELTYNSGFFSSCNIYIDSVQSTIKDLNGSTLNANVSGSNSIKVQGPSGSGNDISGVAIPSPTFSSSNETDPLSTVTAPTFSSCDHYATVVVLFSTLNPGTYCGGITILGATVTFKPGLYIVTGGMTWQNGSTINGTGVTFYLTSGGGSTYGNFNIWNSTVTLSAPTSTSGGGVSGIVVFVDRNWLNNGQQGIQILASYVTTNGIWYALNTGIYNSVSTLRGTTYLGFVVDAIQGSAATFTIPSPDYSSISGGSPFTSGSTVSIVQ